MRSDQHKQESSSKKILPIIFILVLIFAIGYLGYNSISKGNLPSFSKAKTEETTKEDKNNSKVSATEPDDLEELSKALDCVNSLYTDSNLSEPKKNLSKEDLEKAKKQIDKVSDKSKAKKELIELYEKAKKAN